MSDSSSDEAAPVVPRSRKRRKLVPQAEGALISSSSSSCTASSTASLTTLSTDFLLKTNAIDAGPAIKKKKSAIDAIPTVEAEEKRRRDIQNLISSSSDEENVENSFRAATTTKSPSPPPPPDLNVSAPIEEACRGGGGGRRGRGGRKKSKRKSAVATGGLKTTAKANKGLKAVQQLRSLHAQMQYQTHTQDVMTNLQAMMHDENLAPTKEDEIVLKIRSPAGVQRLKQGKRESLVKTFAKMAEIENCDASRIVMTFEDREVKRTDSPASLNLTIADILECLVLRDAEGGGGASSQDGTEEEEGGGETDGTIRLKIQSLDSKTGKFIVVKVKPDAPLSEMMATAAEEMAVEDRSKLIFRFDGDVIDPGSTAEDLDMEDDDCVDVVMRK